MSSSTLLHSSERMSGVLRELHTCRVHSVSSVPLTYLQKNSVVIVKWFLFVCLCVWRSLQKSAVTFNSLDPPGQNYQGPRNSAEVIFGRVNPNPQHRGSGSDPPQKGGFCQIYILPGYWSRGSCHTFLESRQWGKQNVGERNFDFWPTARKKWGRKAGLDRGRPKFSNFNIFHNWDHLNPGAGHFLFNATFWSDTPRGPRGYPRSWEG